MVRKVARSCPWSFITRHQAKCRLPGCSESAVLDQAHIAGLLYQADFVEFLPIAAPCERSRELKKPTLAALVSRRRRQFEAVQLLHGVSCLAAHGPRNLGRSSW
jgi:hypothetical protein